jgi:hypothetical protein
MTLRESVVPCPPTLTKLTLVLDRNTGMEQKGQYKKLIWFSEFRHVGFFFKFTGPFPEELDEIEV